MRKKIAYLSILISIIITPMIFSEPGFNGSTPGCNASGCHSHNAGIVSAVVNGMVVEITVSGTSSKVAGELVDKAGNVVDVISSTSSNPFTLTAPSGGMYLVNAGYKNPGKQWDSVSVVISVTGVDDNDLEPVSTYKLYNNYPNPFNPSTKIRYSLPVKSNVNLQIYDAAGKEVASLVDGEQPAGEHEINFDAENLTSGVYFYKLQAGSFIQTKKMLLLK